MLLFDSHLDIAWNAIDWDRDLDLTVAELREVEIARLAQAQAGDTSDMSPIFRRTSAALPGMGRNTLTLSTCHSISGFQKILSRMPRAADGVMTS